MKKLLLIFVALFVAGFATQLCAQCTVSGVTTNIKSSQTDPNNPSNCLVTFDLQFNIDANNGFKITVIQAWRQQDYPAYWGNNCTQNKNKAPNASNLKKNGTGPLPFLNIAFETTSSGYVPLSTYFDNTVPVQTGYTITAGTPSGGFIPITISNVTVSVPGGCSGVTIIADLWGTQGNITSQWQPHCVNCNNVYAFNYPSIVGTQSCELINNIVQRRYSFTVTNSNTNQSITVNSYRVYRDANGSNLYDAGDVLVGSATINTLLAPNQNFSVPLTAYPGNQGATRDQLLFIVLDVAGFTNDVSTTCAQQACATLPVTFKSFNAQLRNGKGVLSWETATEENNKGFEVQRRIGNGGYQNIGFVASKSPDGNSNTVLSYSFEDANLPANSVAYYRLRQVDIDGKAAFSEIRSLRNNGKVAVSLYPNPSRGTVNISIPSGSGLFDVSLDDYTGRSIQRWTHQNTPTLQINNLKSGVYMLRIYFRDTGEQLVERVLVQ